MTVNTHADQGTLTVTVEGRLDTTTAPQLEHTLKAEMTDITKLILDFSQLEYISSAGLRVLLAAQKVMNKQGDMIIRHANDVVKEVFEVTGFSDILTLE